MTHLKILEDYIPKEYIKSDTGGIRTALQTTAVSNPITYELKSLDLSKNKLLESVDFSYNPITPATLDLS